MDNDKNKDRSLTRKVLIFILVAVTIIALTEIYPDDYPYWTIYIAYGFNGLFCFGVVTTFDWLHARLRNRTS